MFYPFYFNATEEDNREKGKLYKPQPQAKHEDKVIEKVIEPPKTPVTPVCIPNVSKKESSAKKANKAQEKKKSNLELFKEELRQ